MILAAAALVACWLPGAQTPAKPAPSTAPQPGGTAKPPLTRPLFENERVRVIEAVWEPGASVAAFKGFPSSEMLGVVAVVLKGGAVEHLYAGGKKVRQERRPGEVFFQPPDRAVEARQNVGGTRLDMIQVALKKAPPTRQYTGPADGARKLFENARVVVFELALAPGAKTPVHKYAPRVWVILEGGDMRSWDKEGKPQEARFASSQVIFLPAQEHTLENIGKANQRIISVELK
jgi:predicted metal-dependent enzyme (double-stranded beta helix superfamily)